MSRIVDEAALVLTGLVLVPAFAHALELPGKLRLDEREYRATQRIYYPGFTVVGVAELAAPLLTLASFVTPPRTRRRRRAYGIALAGLVGMQAVFWIVTQPVNRVWVEGVPLGRAGSRFFHRGDGRARSEPGWIAARNRWEASHVVRAGLAIVSLVASWVGARASAPRRARW